MPNPYTPPDLSRGFAYPAVDAHKIAYVEIFPPIGIARVGDSGTFQGKRIENREIEYFYTPEVPHDSAITPDFKFRDSHQRIRRQAARFRVYAYNSEGIVLGEINEHNNYHLEWTVDVANTKAATTLFRGRFEPQTTELRNPDVQPDYPEQHRDRLIVRPGAATVAGISQAKVLTGKFQGSREEKDAIDVTLGEARTDENGRLVFIGGSGYARCVSQNSAYKPDKEYPHQPNIISEFDNIDWIDDTCDGIVSLKFYHKSDASKKLISARHTAHIMVAPPNFAWGINASTTLYDIIENLYNKASPTYVADQTVSFYRDIWPVLSGAYNLSWVNKEAFQGHGPNGKGNFLLIESDLIDTSSKKQGLRQHIFHRLRMPDQLNADQASTKYMPRLSGDGGGAIEPGTIQTILQTPDPIARFASLTALQYERFKRWRDGKFKTEPYPALNPTTHKPPTRIEDVAISHQPEYLTRAHLETTVGDPVYPGIETYWIAKLASTYDMSVDPALNPPFRIASKLKPGDMTKALSLPWQSDFAQCNTNWWPSSRPDDVVPEAAYDKVKSVVGQDVAAALEKEARLPWTRLFRKPVEEPNDFFPNCTDMVRHWQRLGFIAQVEPTVSGGLPVYIEKERTLPLDLGDN